MSSTVLAFCPDQAANHFLFVPVLAQVVNGRLMRVAGPPLTPFPPSGTVYVPRDLLPDPFDYPDVAFWDVQDQPDYARRNLGARFRAVRLREDCPAEIIPLPCSSEEVDQARRLLLEMGLCHVCRLCRRDVLLEFTDGWITGPVRFRPADPDRRSRCLPTDLDQPLPAWRSRADFEPLSLAVGKEQRLFASLLQLPPPDRYLDLAPLERALDSLFRVGGLENTLDPAEVEHLIKHLSELPPSAQLNSRRQRLLHLLEQSRETGRQLGDWAQQLLAHPLLQQHLGQYKMELEQRAAHSLQEREHEWTARLERLRAEEEQTKQRLADLKAECVEEEKREQQRAGALTEAILTRTREAQEDAARLLADVSVLRPFLAPATLLPLERSEAPDARPLPSVETALALLQDNLEGLGLTAPSAQVLAREVLAGAGLGQALLFQGSLAGPLARAVALSLAGRHWLRLDLPSGLTTASEVDRAVREAIRPAPLSSALLLEGANRSSIDLYGPALTRLFTDRALGADTPGLLVLGTVLDDPSVLLPGSALTAFGPVFHSDYLAWKRQPASSRLRPGQLQAADWPSAPADVFSADPLGHLLDALCPLPNELWRRNVLAAFGRLAALHGEQDSRRALASVLFAWVLPRALATGTSLAANAGLLRHLTAEAVKSDPRLQRFLKAHGVETGA